MLAEPVFGVISLTVPTAPAGIQPGDSLVAIMSWGEAGGVTPTSPGWAPVGTGSSAGSTQAALTRIAENPVPASYTFTWGAAKFQVIGGIVAHTQGLLGLTHLDSAASLNGPSPRALTLPAHAAAVAGVIVYGFSVGSINDYTGYVMTMPPESTVRGILADISPGLPFGVLGIATEEVNAATEPARDFNFAWGAGAADVCATRTVAVDVSAVGIPGFGFGSRPFGP